MGKVNQAVHGQEGFAVCKPLTVFIACAFMLLTFAVIAPGALAVESKQCSDKIDNPDPEDTLIDKADPGCHTDGNPNNPGSYDPADDDETDEAGPGGDTASPRAR